MAWTIEYDPEVKKDFRKLDREVQREILAYMDERIAKANHPRDFGKPMRYSLQGLWAYRIGHYRAICEIQEERLIVLVVTVGHRSKVYD